MPKAKPVTKLRPQLASRGTWEDKVGSADWIGEEKFDGTRYLAAVTRTGIRIVSRRGIEKTDRLPKLVAELEELRDSSKLPVGSVLDGEVVAGSFSETISLVNSLGTRGVDAVSAYRYMVFDILRLGRDWLLDRPLHDRRPRLTSILGVPGHRTGIVQMTPQFSSHMFETMLMKIWGVGGEGIIIKHVSGRYEQGKRSKSWIKVKAVQTADGVIVGFTPGEGKYHGTIGAIVIGQYRDGKFQRVCKISGMTDEVRYELGSNQGSYTGKVVEFAFQNKTDDSYRHPRFKRFRPDKSAAECSWEDS